MNTPSWIRRYWPLWVVIIVAVILWWPGRAMYLDVLTEREAARIAAITPDQGAESTPERLDIERMMDDLTWLAAPERMGRFPGSEGGLAAREFIETQFTELGLLPAGSEGFLHPFTHEGVDNAANVLGMLPGRDPSLRTIVISAHYDHLGVKNGDIYHGADDNASGTAALLEYARYFTENQPNHTLLFAALDSEEHGLLGAHALFNTGHLTPSDIAFNVNVDMLSRDTDQLLFAVGTYHHPWLVPLVRRVQQENEARIVMAHDRPKWKAGHTEDWTMSSDHGAFHRVGIPFIYFGVADHPDYHSPRDTADKVDVEFYRITSEAALSFIKLIDQVLQEKIATH
ncbi:M28 family peptidase [Aliidiomarina halalkaliphila]|uniref:M28 family peptidase n=1 Tax=Aliidiomarina halalkaliphila TaxID=2593535 RepID=A0A552WZ36_9GAMM|nr:M28 family peptidase [Aliidiomarina halalkaliphila]TRW48057.1 M28 family peptidase [Aliidiomarina halalkaliphila]